jgi:hypothetical protein
MAADILSSQPTFVKQPELSARTPGPRATPERANSQMQEGLTFAFDTRVLILVGSPLAFFLHLGKGQLIARKGRERTKNVGRDIALDRAGRYGCLACDTVYNGKPSISTRVKLSHALNFRDCSLRCGRSGRFRPQRRGRRALLQAHQTGPDPVHQPNLVAKPLGCLPPRLANLRHVESLGRRQRYRRGGQTDGRRGQGASRQAGRRAGGSQVGPTENSARRSHEADAVGTASLW